MPKELNTDDVVPFQFKLPRTERDALKRHAKSTDTDASKIIRKLIRDYLKEHQQARLI